MCLSEPQAGSSLSDVSTRATLEDESGDPLGARYRLVGRKMWISAGEHEITENIVHLVLARIWLDVALAGAGRSDDAASGRRAAMRYFFAYELPKIGAWLAVVAAREAVCQDMREGWF
jgi:hypothetical protein